MKNRKKKSRLAAKINTAEDTPVFSEAQVNTFDSAYVDSLDEALSVLDENNRTVIGHPISFKADQKDS